uniref:Dipeptidyl peptidase like 10 n=1 Tax=Eptatretus burgeri TaxID=7764 RepID=A0A8C4NCI7_EPTBU
MTTSKDGVQSSQEQEVMVSNSSERNWKGIAIALMVIIAVCSLIVMSVILLTPDEDPSQALKSNFTLDDLFSPEFELTQPTVSWISGNELIYRNSRGDVTKVNVETNQSTVLVENSVFVTLKATEYQVSPDLKYVLLAYNVQQVYRNSYKASYSFYNIHTREVSELNPPEVKNAVLQYASWGVQRQQLVFIFENNLYYQAEVWGSALRLTSSGKEGVVFNGLGDCLYQEELLHGPVAHWWSPDARWLAYLTINGSDVPFMEIPSYTGRLYPHSHSYSYPKAGQRNPHVRLMVAMLYGITHVLELKPPEILRSRDLYVSMVRWATGTRLAVNWLNRPQNFSILSLCDVTMGACNEGHQQDSDAWLVRPHAPPVFSRDGLRFFLPVPVKQGARGDFHHIAMFTPPRGGRHAIVRFITSGNWEVTKILAYDELRQKVYFLSTEDSPQSRHIYSAETVGTFNRQCLSCGLIPNCSYFDASFSHNCLYFTLQCLGESIPKLSIHRTQDWQEYFILEDNAQLSELLMMKRMPRIRYHTVKTGDYILPVQLQLPSTFREEEDYPLLLMLEERPGWQSVTERFNIGWDSQLVSVHNVIVARFDGRGSGFRGNRLLHELRHKLGVIEVKDAIMAVRSLLTSHEFIDKRRIGVYGKAYGGYLSIVLLGTSQGLFKCAVANAPVTDWRNFASAFSERYLGHPHHFEKTYEASKAAHRLGKVLDQKLMLLHGTADEIVHFQHTAELIKELIATNGNYTLPVREHVHSSCLNTCVSKWAQSNFDNHCMRQTFNFTNT